MLLEKLVSLDSSTTLFLTATSIIFFITWLLSKAWPPYFKRNIPPFPAPPLPFFGHLLMLGDNNREMIKASRDKVGDVFSLDARRRLIIVVSGYETIKGVLVTNADKVPDRPHSVVHDLVKEDHKGIIGGLGSNAKEQRSVSLSIFRALGVGKNLLAQKISEEVATCTEKLAAKQGQAVEIENLIYVTTFNIICSVVTGKHFEHTDPEFIRFLTLLRGIMKYSIRLPLYDAFPFLQYLPGDLFHAKKFASCVREFNETFSVGYIREIKNTLNEEDDPCNFIAAYLQEIRKKGKREEVSELDEENLVAIIRDLFIAGAETTAVTILWCLLYILHNPRVQEKIYAEIESKIDHGRAPDMGDKPRLTYLNAVIMETQRLSSIAPFLLREVSTAFEYSGFKFPAKSILVVNLDSVLRDKKIWGDPDTFRPERFLDDEGNLQKPEQFIPFLLGKRTCIGEALAKMELFLFLATMFQRFKFEPAESSGELPPLREEFGVTCAPIPFKIRATERR